MLGEHWRLVLGIPCRGQRWRHATLTLIDCGPLAIRRVQVAPALVILPTWLRGRPPDSKKGVGHSFRRDFVYETRGVSDPVFVIYDSGILALKCLD